MKKFVNKKEFSELLGCLPPVITRYIKKGEIKIENNGKIDISSKEMQEYINIKKIEIQKHKNKITKKDDKIELQNSEFKTEIQIIESKDLIKLTEIEKETKIEKLKSEKLKAQILEMDVKERTKELINFENLNKILSTTIGTLAKNLLELPINISDEIIDLVKIENNPKELLINFLTKNIHKEINSTINKIEKFFNTNYG